MFGCGKPPAAEPGVSRMHPDPVSACPTGDNQIALHQDTFQVEPDLPHLFDSSITDWDSGKMDGFSKWGTNHDDAAYDYVERSQVAPYWTMASQYVLADAMYPTEFGPSWTAHLALVAGTDNLSDQLALADFADGHNDCHSQPGTKTTTVDVHRVIRRDSGPYPCLDQFNTMAQLLDTAGISWKYYVASALKSFIWSPFAGIKYVHDGQDWDDSIISPQTQILTDVAQGKLAAVSWVTPNHADSDHSAAHSDTGPSWVASVINAIGKSSYWNTTAIIVLWDDWGGFYDNAPLPQLDFRGLGIRVPCLIISPYAKRNYVSHTQYEFGSILKFIEGVFGLSHLGPPSQGYTDGRANGLHNAFNFTQSPRAFKPIPAKYSAEHFLREPPSNEPVDTE